MKTKENNKGISLIVLIITIIVVIILVALVILTLSKNNPIESAKEARFKEDVRLFQDELSMTVSKDYTNKAGQRDYKISTSDFDEIKEYIPSFSKKYKGKFIIKDDELIGIGILDEKETKYLDDINCKSWAKAIKEVTNDGVPIPKGFSYLIGTKETGTVIKDELENEYVWIPVNNISEYKKDLSLESPTAVIEDDTLPDTVSSEIFDVEKYGGFYIGRYEAGIPITKINVGAYSGIPVSKKDAIVWVNIYYSLAKSNAEKMVKNSYIQSGLLTGRAWDTTCHYIEDSVDSIKNSRKYGNYAGSLSPANVEGYGERQVAGYSDAWCVKNIYDLAGNVHEWTNEKRGSYPVVRGGHYMNNWSVLYRSVYNSAYKDTGFRVRLYITE